MSQLFETLKTIRAKRDAAGREYTRVAIRVREPTPVRQSLPSSRWNPGIARGLITFIGGGIVAAFATALWWDWPTQGWSPPTVSVAAAPEALPSPAVLAANEVPEPAAMAMVAVAAPTPEPAAASAAPVADQPTIANQPAADALPEPVPAGEFWVQLGAFNEHANADRFHARLLRKQRSAVIRPGPPNAPSWVVAVGPFPDERSASEARGGLAREGFPGFVIR